MTEVTDILRDRRLEPGGFEQMAMVSVLVHGGLIALALLAPGRWWTRDAATPQPFMTITLGGGAAGPQSGGLTSLGGRPVQEATPPDEPVKREAVRPPAAKPPEMTLPDPKAKPTKAAPAPKIKEAAEGARGRTPTRGEETRSGSTVADTGVRGQGFGLSTGGGPGSGSKLDVANFCCPEYLELMVERIRANWNPRSEFAGENIVKFTIYRDGSIRDISVEKTSTYFAHDLSSQRAVLMTKTLPPLPTAFTNPTLTVHLNFQYQR
jgi:outer membrane biosynthesis protein TonB